MYCNEKKTLNKKIPNLHIGVEPLFTKSIHRRVKNRIPRVDSHYTTCGVQPNYVSICYDIVRPNTCRQKKCNTSFCLRALKPINKNKSNYACPVPTFSGQHVHNVVHIGQGAAHTKLAPLA